MTTTTKIISLGIVALVVVALFASSAVGVLIGFLGVIVKFGLVLVVAIIALVGARHWISRVRSRR